MSKAKTDGRTIALTFKVNEAEAEHIEASIVRGEYSDRSEFCRAAVGKYCTQVTSVYMQRIKPNERIASKPTNARGKLNRLAAKRFDVDLAMADAYKDHVERMGNLAMERNALTRLIDEAAKEIPDTEAHPPIFTGPIGGAL